jgi:NitT/TauT family transport system substrate-binding protein
MQKCIIAALAVFCLGLTGPADAADPMVLQLKWLADAQFAGYFAAAAKGYYRDAGLDVTIKPGGPDINPSEVLAAGGADVAVDWMASTLATRERHWSMSRDFHHSGLHRPATATAAARLPTLGEDAGGLVCQQRISVPLDGQLARRAGGSTACRRTVLRLEPASGSCWNAARRISTMSYNEYWQVIDSGVKAAQVLVFR